ncbi:MAG: hypothetical protein OEY94_03725 [Alphaproteobacteria bacterium]|nr:hypothetical protein [Alphaproteobacteria bacterium]
MGYDNKEAREKIAREKIENIYGRKLESCRFERDFVLRATFKGLVDVSSVLHQDPDDAQRYFNSDLFSLSQNTPVIIFGNALVEKKDNGTISALTNNKYILQQDPFHYDYWDSRLKDPKRVTFLFKDSYIFRDAPTYFALPGDVKRVVSKMQPLNVHEKVIAALKEMAQSDYTFSLQESEHKARYDIIRGYPEFTDTVYKAIPEGSKFAHYWMPDKYVVTMHYNDGDKLLHARGSSKYDNINKIKICDFFEM